MLPELLYSRVIEARERVAADGEVLVPLDEEAPAGPCARPTPTASARWPIVCLHGYRFPAHEQRIGQIARGIGFTQVSLSARDQPADEAGAAR